MDIELILWALAGGIIVACISAGAIYYQQESPNVKQISRDFLIGAAFTGFFYPLIPETFQDIQGSVKSVSDTIVSKVASAASSSSGSTHLVDVDVKIGPPNF